MAGSRQHSIVCYSIDSINALKLFCFHVTYILHDKDKRKNGVEKKAHYHVLAYTENQKTSTAFYKCYCRAMIRYTNNQDYFDEEEHDDIKCSYVQNVECLTDYFTHENAEDKYRYSIDDVQGDFEWWKENAEVLNKEIKQEKEDWTLTLLNLIIEQGNKITHQQILDVVRSRGRDALLNLRRVLDSLQIIVHFRVVDTLDEPLVDECGIPVLVDKNGEIRGREIGGDSPFVSRETNYK